MKKARSSTRKVGRHTHQRARCDMRFWMRFGGSWISCPVEMHPLQKPGQRFAVQHSPASNLKREVDKTKRARG